MGLLNTENKRDSPKTLVQENGDSEKSRGFRQYRENEDQRAEKRDWKILGIQGTEVAGAG